MRIPEPDYHFFLEAMANRKPGRMPIYEHNIDPGFIQKVIDVPMVELFGGTPDDQRRYMKHFVDFWERCGYDTVSFELLIPWACPGSGSLRLHTPPVLTCQEDVDRYPWDRIPGDYFEKYGPLFEMFAEEIFRHPGLRGIGGPGMGIFETVQDLVDFQELCYLRSDDPEMVEDVFHRVTDLYTTIWSRFLRDYAEPYCVCRMGDDLGFSQQTLLPHDDIRRLIIPGYKKIVDLVHASGHPFILHSCGKIFDVMEDILATGIDAKHSNEDQIAPFHRWVELYGDRICNLGGIDMNVLCTKTPEEIRRTVLQTIEENVEFGGFALGCGNSIPDYIPVESFFAMNQAANDYRIRQYGR